MCWQGQHRHCCCCGKRQLLRGPRGQGIRQGRGLLARVQPRAAPPLPLPLLLLL